jgi:hypothetical protein
MSFNLVFFPKKMLQVTFNADKWENNAWQKDVYSDNRNFFDFIDSYWSKVWQNAANKISPPITDSRRIPSVLGMVVCMPTNNMFCRVNTVWNSSKTLTKTLTCLKRFTEDSDVF